VEISESSATKHLNAYKFRDEGDEGDWHSRDEFLDAYKNSKYYQAVCDAVDSDIAGEGENDDDDDEDEEDDEEKGESTAIDKNVDDRAYDKEAKYPTNVLYQFCLLLFRSIMADRRAPQTFISQVVGIVIEALIIGTLFLQMGHGQVRVSLHPLTPLIPSPLPPKEKRSNQKFFSWNM